MEKKKTQAERVLDYIQNNGLDIDKQYVTSKNRHGENCTYAKYTLRKEV